MGLDGGKLSLKEKKSVSEWEEIRNESVALPATLEISDTPARSGVVSRAAARLRIKLIPELGGPSFTRVAPRAPSPTPVRVEVMLLYTRQPAIAEPRESHSLRIR